MKAFIRSFVFSYIAVFVIENLIDGFSFNFESKVLLVLALSLISLFSKPLLKMLSLPDGGLGYLVILIVLILVTMYILTVFIPNFAFVATTTKNLNILSFVIPSKHLTPWAAAVYSALIYSLTVSFFDWLSKGKK